MQVLSGTWPMSGSLVIMLVIAALLIGQMIWLVMQFRHARQRDAKKDIVSAGRFFGQTWLRQSEPVTTLDDRPVPQSGPGRSARAIQ